MDELSRLEALEAFQGDLVSLKEGRLAGAEAITDSFLTQTFQAELEKLWDRPPRSEASKTMLQTGKIKFANDEYSVNSEFQQMALAMSNELDLDEVESAKYLLEAQSDVAQMGRPLLECAIVRHHRQRESLLDSVALLFELDSHQDDTLEQNGGADIEAIQAYVDGHFFSGTAASPKRMITRCSNAMSGIKQWLQKLNEKIVAAQTLGMTTQGRMSEEMETVEFSRVSLLRQHETLAIIVCRCIEKRQAEKGDFTGFFAAFKKTDRYDMLLIHQMPILGSYISAFGSTEGAHDLSQARKLSDELFSPDTSWSLQPLKAATQVWWLAEYSGFYLGNPPESQIPATANLDEEDRQRSKTFFDCLKDGAFDMLLSIAGDVKSRDWHDPVRTGMRKWLQRKSPPLSADSTYFSDSFQQCLMAQLEVFIDAFISNLPDVLRKLRVEEDEQRSLSQAHEQDLDLERFLFIIAYAYEGRPDAATNFWSDPDSNLAGFMHWASRRASTPLVTAFCEMLQAISGNDECSTAAHEFLLDEGHHSSGKMGRFQSLTWSQIFKELAFFSEKNKPGSKPVQSTSSRYRESKPSSDLVEREPESAMMLECYLRLITKLTSESETSRQFFLNNSFNVVEVMLELASSEIPDSLCGCIFTALGALMSRKTLQEGYMMWNYLDHWVSGGFEALAAGQQRPTQQSAAAATERNLHRMAKTFEQANSLVQLLTTLVSPSSDSSPLNDSIPFPENLGSASRVAGIEVYVDFVMGLVFSSSAMELSEVYQTRVLKLSCLDFILTCLGTFNETLILLANKTNLQVDAVIAASDLASYVKMHPFGRVMEWMFNDKVMKVLFNTVQQDVMKVANVAADSPLVLGILRGVEVISKVLDLQATFLDIVRLLLKTQTKQRRQAVGNAAYSSFEDGLVTRIGLVVSLGLYCGIKNPQLTLACLKLLERMSSSPKITTVWSGSDRQAQRNKAIVAMEANGEYEAISRSFDSELLAPIDQGLEAESSVYVTKVYILDFLYRCLKMTPHKPTIAHLLMGFNCGIDTLSIDAGGSFADRTSLFHDIIRILCDTPSSDESGMRQWLLALKTRAMRILHVLWSSPLSAPIVIEELRENNFLYLLLLRESVIQTEVPWEGEDIAASHFTMTDGATTLLDLLALRGMTFEYVAMELCLISQGRMPSTKRKIFEALGGQVVGDNNEPIQVPTIFDLYDFVIPTGYWELPPPQLEYYKGMNFDVCVEIDDDGNSIYNINRAKEVLLLKRSESQSLAAIISVAELEKVEQEEAVIQAYLVATNRQQQIAARSIMDLKTWARVLLVMVQFNDFKGTAQTAFFLQALQAILPSLEDFASDRPAEAFELASLAKIIMYKLDLASTDTSDKDSKIVGHLTADKLYQLFQISLQAIGRMSETTKLRSIYYEICYRYLISMTADGPLSSSREQTLRTVHVYGERLINVMCDDAYCGDTACQTSALILLNALVALGRLEQDDRVVETLNKLNFIGIVVDSLRDIMGEWHGAFSSGHKDRQNYQNARLSLLLQLAQTRPGSKYIIHSNLFRTLETSGLFSADPELQSSQDHNGEDASKVLAQHYDLLAKVVRIIGATLLSRGSSNINQGRKFLVDHRMLLAHTLKRSAGIGGDGVGQALEENMEDLADGFLVIISATGFLEYEESTAQPEMKPDYVRFH